MQAIWKSKGNILHTRNITVTTYNYDQQRIIVSGMLKDNRFQEAHMVTGETLPPGVVHHMSIRLLVNCSNLSIEDIAADIISVPEKLCQDTIGCIDSIKGLTITRGFTAKVKRLAGGKKGCTHLVELLLVMAQAAYQGLIAYRAQKPSAYDHGHAKRALESLFDTCRAWSENGPLTEKYKRLINMT